MKRTGLLFLDIVALYSALSVTLMIRYGGDFNIYLDLHILPFTYIFFFWILIFYITNLYDTGQLRNNLSFYTNLLRSITIALAISIIFFYLLPYFSITPKTNLLIFAVLFTGLSAMFRTIFNKFNERAFKKPILIVGSNIQALELAKFIQENPQFGYNLKYIIDTDSKRSNEEEKEIQKFPLIKNVGLAEETIRTENINTVIISPEAYQTPHIIDTFYKLLENRVTFRNLPSFYEELTGKVPLGAINQIWFLENLTEGSKKKYEEAKRLFDMIFAIIAGLIVLPFFPMLAALIKAGSKGTVFYRQIRLGQKGSYFEIIKFRTMRTDAEKETGAIWAQEDDPRVTWLGRIFRKTRIDELPQLWNILKGDMSFVGPRAERPEFNEKLKIIPFYEERYIVKPGLTGWAQINYRYGSSVFDAAEKLQYDLYYIKNRSLIFDLGIILKTINIALKQAGR